MRNLVVTEICEAALGRKWSKGCALAIKALHRSIAPAEADDSSPGCFISPGRIQQALQTNNNRQTCSFFMINHYSAPGSITVDVQHAENYSW